MPFTSTMDCCQLHHTLESWVPHLILVNNSVANVIAICLHVYEHHLTHSNTDFYINMALLAFSNASSRVLFYCVMGSGPFVASVTSLHPSLSHQFSHMHIMANLCGSGCTLTYPNTRTKYT